MVLDFLVVDVAPTPILGLKNVCAVGSGAASHGSKCLRVVASYKDVFEGLGSLGTSHKIRLRADAVRVVHAPRRVAASLMKPLREELDCMLSLGVIEKGEEPTEWVSLLVLVEKPNGKLRLCLDPKPRILTSTLCGNIITSTASEVTREMAGAQYFTKLDASTGFWHMSLDEDSTRLTMFNTPFGRYCFRCLPFGISSAPGVFHKTVQQLFEGFTGVRSIHDDIIIWGKDKTEHDNRVINVLQKARQANLKLNRSKCMFSVH